jgi:AAA domain
MDASYRWGEAFQLRLLALLVQKPAKVMDSIEPQYFTSPIFVETARVLKEAYAVSKSSKVSQETLKEMLQASVGKDDAWDVYKSTVKKIYGMPLEDEAILLPQVFEFSKEARYKEAIELCEKDISNRLYQRVHERIDKLRNFGNGASPATSIRALRDSLRKQMDKPPKEVEWDVPGFFPTCATILFGGRKGEGKSYLLQALGKASREGSELAKGLPVKKKRFLYLVREGAQELYDQRFREFGFDYRKQSRKFQIWGPWMEPMPPKILETGAPYRGWAKEFAPCSMAIDGLRRFFDGDENSSEVMDPIGQELTAWTVNGATVYVAHHRGKSRGIDSRGSSAIEDFVGVQYVVEALREGQRISKIRLRCVKNWYGEEKALLLEPHWEGGKFWFTGGEDTEAEDRWARDKEKVLSQTSVTEWTSRTRILEDLEGEIGRDRIIEILESESGKNGKLRARRRSKPGAPFEYRRVRAAEADSSSDDGEGSNIHAERSSY